MNLNSYIRGVGSHLPARVLTNEQLSQTVDTSDEWIRERTGINQRYIAAEGQNTSDLGYGAALDALANAKMDVSEIDLIVVATSTPDLTFPSTATIIQEKLGLRTGAAFDIQAVCSGFVYALSVADAMIKNGSAENVLVIGAETFSRILDWNDRTTCVLFGDGAGALILSTTPAKNKNAGRGVLNTFIRSNGQHKELLYVDGGPSATQTVGKLRMQGNQVFRHAVKELADSMKECAGKAGYEINDIEWFVPHQANQRILEAVAKRLDLRRAQVVSTVAFHANTSAASIPLALDVAIKDGRIKRGHKVMLEAFGGGFTWGAALLEY
ncbi:MAG: ketoacyl-ACP synthase III [Acidimicrobiales bacterium]|nr:ketoacyl-ACP synthase III [Hyphomonadaceae bacterium]RZV42740.1 MAG: ketoacyl-ACP synthase III [Acidimicrobiales bacterium]